MTNEEKAKELAENNLKWYYELGNSYDECYQSALQAMVWKDEQILLDDDDKLATEVKIDGVTITPPQGYLIGRVTHINDSLIVELKKK